MTTAEQMQRAKELIQAKRYDDARALLVTIDHPKAGMWLNRLNQMGSSGSIQTASDKSFTTKLFISIVLLLFWAVPSIIALAIFAPEAKKYPDAPGAKALIALNRFTFILLIIGGVAAVVMIILPVLLNS